LRPRGRSPPRARTTDNERRYAYSGLLASDAVIHSLTAD